MTNQNDRIAELEAAIAELQEMVNVCEMDRNRARAELARLRPLAELYPLAWEECKWHRRTNEECTQQKGCWIYSDARLIPIEFLNEHDDARARAERGVE
jgi:hypothetical protein